MFYNSHTHHNAETTRNQCTDEMNTTERANRYSDEVFLHVQSEIRAQSI